MKSALRLHTFLLTLSVAVAAATSQAFAEPGLLLIAHGSPRAEWNQPVLDFGRRVAEEVEREGRFKAVRTAMLESVRPDVPTAVAELESEGCDRIIAVPLFVAPTGHTHFDVPAVLGIFSSPTTAAALADEGARAARPKVPITLTQTLSEGDLLHHYALDQVRKLSKSPNDEALVILAHGDPKHHLLADRLMRQITTYCCGEAGISYGDWAYVAVGQRYLSDGVAAVERALCHKRRVLVVGVYLSLSALEIHARRVGVSPSDAPRPGPFGAADVVFCDEAIISHPDLLPWVRKAASAALSPVSHPDEVMARRQTRP